MGYLRLQNETKIENFIYGEALLSGEEGMKK
jgi:hypothetical protein